MKKVVKLIKRSVVFCFIACMTVLVNANAQEEDENEFDYGRYTAAFLGGHSGYVQNDGSLFMWGDNRNGALGTKTFEEGGSDDIYSPKFITKKMHL